MSNLSDYDDADTSAMLVSLYGEGLWMGGNSHCDRIILPETSLEAGGIGAARRDGGGVDSSTESGSSTITYSDGVAGTV